MQMIHYNVHNANINVSLTYLFTLHNSCIIDRTVQILQLLQFLFIAAAVDVVVSA